VFYPKLLQPSRNKNNSKPNEIKHLQWEILLSFFYSLKIIYTPPTFFTLLPFTGKTSLCVYKKFVFLALLGFGADFPKIREFCQKALAYHATTRIE
jgi:phosphatidylglycerophosphatase A